MRLVHFALAIFVVTIACTACDAGPCSEGTPCGDGDACRRGSCVDKQDGEEGEGEGEGEGEICDDGISNDGDRFVDCDDFDCDDDVACGSDGPEICNDGISNDGDRFVDCDDFDCDFDPACDIGPPIDRTRCFGYAHGSNIQGVDTSTAIVDDGVLHLLLSDAPLDTLTEGRAYFQLDVRIVDGILDYPSGNASCAIVTLSNGSLVVETMLQLCEIVFDEFSYASSTSSCSGTISGAAAGYDFDFNPFGGGFETPWQGTASAFAGNQGQCRGPDQVCSTSGDCCSQSCSLALGRCN
jgi:hypothetical protein